MNPLPASVPGSAPLEGVRPDTERRASPFFDSPVAAELEAVRWLHEQVSAGKPLPLVEARTIVDSLFHEIRWGGGVLGSLAFPDAMEAYHAAHAVNVCLLSMALARNVQFDDDAARRIGLAGLLHDIGMLRVDPDLLARPGQLTAMEREQVKRHPEEGAHILFAADPSLDLAAVVAYEHHIKIDGSGYPRPQFRRSAHYISRLIQVCDVYHALRSPRPFRPAWPDDVITSFLTERAGFEFHPALAAALTALIHGSAA
jgi:HD-GYP domain-containing protein (c-di-GMP phosphodiesterase class II)